MIEPGVIEHCVGHALTAIFACSVTYSVWGIYPLLAISPSCPLVFLCGPLETNKAIVYRWTSCPLPNRDSWIY